VRKFFWKNLLSARIAQCQTASFILLLSLLAGCQSSKIYKLMQEGSVEQEQFYASVPFEFRAGIPVMQVEVNGEKGWFLFDTGAPNVISKKFAARLNLQAEAKGRIDMSRLFFMIICFAIPTWLESKRSEVDYPYMRNIDPSAINSPQGGHPWQSLTLRK
jgi:hypothetical protein